MMDHEVHGRVHEHLIKVVENIPAADTFPARSPMFRTFDDPEEYQEALWGHHHLCGPEKKRIKILVKKVLFRVKE
jgi:hypothetical protein